MAAPSVNNALPKIPGYDFSALNQPVTHGQSRGLTFVEGVATVKPVHSQPVAGSVGPGGKAQAAKFSEQNLLRSFAGWNTLDGKVLRFHGYFTERVPESAVETLRVRRVTLFYYLADNTLALNEAPPAGNAGMRGGCLMSRHADANVGIASLKLGAFLELRGRTLTLVECDQFTRDFFTVMRMPIGEPGEYPPDTFAAAQAAKTRGAPKDDDYRALKQSLEMTAASASGRAVSTMTREERERTERFLKHDREVLNFFATWDKRLFRISYFVADRTIAVNALKSPNDGRDPVAAFIKRGRIPRGKFATKAIDTISAPRDAREDYFTDADLGTGITLSMFGRDFFIFDCDVFTRQYYADNFGRDVKTFDKGFTEGDGSGTAAASRSMELPPHNGFGTDEDSLGSVRHMVPKAPKKDYVKYIRHAHDVLRYSAEIDQPLPEDEGRRFIMCFYLADDTLSVFEYAVRNSGHGGGKLFARAKVPGVSPASMTPGSVIKLCGRGYRLIEADERTEKFLETGEAMGAGPDSTAEDLLARVRMSLTQKFLRVTDAYRHFCPGTKGIGFNELRRMFRECEVKVENDEMLARIMQLVDTDGDGLVSLQEFVENVLKQTLAGSSNSAASRAAAATRDVDSGAYLADQRQRAMRQFADQVLKTFVAKLEARRAYILDAFRIVSDRSVDGLVGADTFRSVVNDRLGLHFTPEEMDALVYRFYYVDNMPAWESRRLSLRDFRKVLEL